ncbi:MAG TPA: 5'-3' exonuclease H3TH domain-containing protein, partial [Gemmataceae bacterium]|nr:5'-3' exonuclease H3TH domain-containing protein [Gemmataceae bacterium]
MYLIDAHSLIFQVFHAIPAMSSPSGLPTNALFGFARDLLFLRYEAKPDYLVCAFDVSGPTFRDQLYAEYKAGRAAMPDDLQLQIPLIYQMLEAMRVPVASAPGYEADDVIATIATAAAGRGVDVSICTSDKDCRQLINDHVCLYSLRKRESLDRAGLLRDWEITPEQVVDLQTLVGDSVDNVPGVRGIGLKTAAKLLQQYGTLEGILANLDNLAVNGIRKGAWLKNLQEAAGAHLDRTRQLVRLATDVPIPMDWEGWKLQPPDAERLLGLFQEWGFHRFSDMVRAQERQPEPRQGLLFSSEPSPAETVEKPGGPVNVQIAGKIAYHLVNTPAQFKEFTAQLQKQKRLAVDLETTGLEPLRADIVGMAFSWKQGEAWYLAFRGPEGEPVLDLKRCLPTLRKVLEDPAVALVNQNIKYDLLVLRHHGVQLAGVAGDSMVADYLLHAGERSHNLEDLANRYLDHRVVPITDLIGKRGKNQLRMDQVPTAHVAEYAGEDADVALRLCDLLEPRLAGEGLDRLYRELEVPLIGVLADMEFSGVRLDIPLLHRLSK